MELTRKQRNEIKRQVHADFMKRRLIIEEKIFKALNSKKGRKK